MMPPRASMGRAPSIALPLRYLLAAGAAFVLAALGVPWLASELAGHYYHPRILALTHAVALGWITMTIMGATYQLVPIVLERPLWSERLARWQFVVLAGGIVGMVAHFSVGHSSGLLWAAGLVSLGVAAHVVNVGLSLRGCGRWTFTARLMGLALAGLALTALFGATLAASRLWPILGGDRLALVQAHFHLALFGWVAPMVLGVAARLYPMFLLAREPEGWPGHLQLSGLAVGVPAVVAGLIAWPVLLPVGAAAIAAALASHMAWVAGMVWNRKRPTLDWGLRLALSGTICLVPGVLTGLALAGGLLAGSRAALAYAVLALGGWISLTIAGMMLKIVPFLVWQQVYAPRVGRAPVPTLGQLSSPTSEAAASVLLVGGTLALAAAVAAGDPAWIRAAGVVLALGALAFGITLARALRHLGASRDREPAVAAMRAHPR